MRSRNILTILNDFVLVGSAFIAISIVLLDFIGMLDKITWLSERVDIITLLILSFLLVNAVIDRKIGINKINESLDNIISSYAFGAQYLDDAGAVIPQLERITRKADEIIMALGAKSRASNYLFLIKEAVFQRNVIHYRLIDGEYIPHALHEHLIEIIKSPIVQLAWTPKEKFGNLLLTENECVIVLPAPYIDKFSGILLPGERNSRRFTHYFLEAFSKSLPVRTEKAIEVLCMQCSPRTAGNVLEITRTIEQEIKTSSEQLTQIKADLF